MLHESGVNLHNLIADLAEVYSYDVAEVVVVELVANSLDAKATVIQIDYDPAAKVLRIEDNGEGMAPQQFERYHDFAAGLKTRGSGIGFAGVGAKISFNVAERVITETRSAGFAGGSDWHYQGHKRLVWEDVDPIHLDGCGTRVTVCFRPDSRIPYATREDIIGLLKTHYRPLFDPVFLNVYEKLRYYSSNLKFVVDGTPLPIMSVESEFALESVERFFPKSAKVIGYGLFGLSPNPYPAGQENYGVLMCTRGKVVKPELFNQFPGPFGPQVFGMVEVPRLVDFLTTGKNDFLRTRHTHRGLEKIYDPVRTEFKRWLEHLGIQVAQTATVDDAEKIEREIKKILDSVPELNEFFGFRTRKTVLVEDIGGEKAGILEEGAETTYPLGSGRDHGGDALLDNGNENGESVESDETGSVRARPISRTARRGPKIGFASVPDRLDLAWVEGNSVVINTGHPSYTRVKANTSFRLLHSLFAIGIAIQRYMVSADGTGDSLLADRLMAAWGRQS